MIYLNIFLAVFSTVLIKYGPVTLMAFEATAILRNLNEANRGEETVRLLAVGTNFITHNKKRSAMLERNQFNFIRN